jgi:hypothetical protein
MEGAFLTDSTVTLRVWLPPMLADEEFMLLSVTVLSTLLKLQVGEFITLFPIRVAQLADNVGVIVGGNVI